MLSFLAIGTLNTGLAPDTSSADAASIAAGNPALDAGYLIVGQEPMVHVFEQARAETTGAAFAELDGPPLIDDGPATGPASTAATAPQTTANTQNQATTTTVLPATATTGGQSTTTAVPATTTTSGGLAAPEGDHFTTLLTGITEAGTNEQWWDAPYFRSLPFASSTGWTDGDRGGYRCFYAFLLNQGQVVGRVTFTRVPEADSYAFINDRYMEEGVRYYNGSLAPADAPRELGECPSPSTAYQPATGSDQRPTITYTLGQTLLEVRNYKNTVVGAGITFRQVESTDSRITVVAYKDNLPAIVIYYDSMVPGLVMDSDLG